MSEPCESDSAVSGPVGSSPSASVSGGRGRPGRSRPAPAGLPARDGPSEGEEEEEAEGPDTVGRATKDTEDTEDTGDAAPEGAAPEGAAPEGAAPEDAEAEVGKAEVGERGVRDGTEGPEGRCAGREVRAGCPAAGREGAPWCGGDAVPEGAEAVPWVEAEAETGTKAEAEGAVDGLDQGDSGPHAEAWPPGRTAAPNPMKSPVARIVAAHSHGVT
ncbi:hypothetical protein [Streptomyces sp. NPDC003393]